MNTHASTRTTTWVALALGLGAIFALLLGLYGLTRFMSRGEVMGRVEVASTPIGGLDTEQALTALVAVEEIYLTRPAIFTLDGAVVNVLPPEAGLDVDEEAIVDDAMSIGRQGNPDLPVRLVAGAYLRHRRSAGIRLGRRRGGRGDLRHLGCRGDRQPGEPRRGGTGGRGVGARLPRDRQGRRPSGRSRHRRVVDAVAARPRT